MPQTLETLAANHEEAMKRRKEGRPVWDHQVTVKHFLDADDAEESPEKVGENIGRVLRESSWFKAETAAHGIGSELAFVVERLEEVSSAYEFDEWMDRLYDLADAARVWIG